MSVRCEKCGYVNDLQHAFCGMCGAKLPVSPAATPPAPSRVPQSAGPGGSSMLGLSHEPSAQDRIAYLLEDDEPPPKSPLRYVIPIVILAGLAWAGWHWRGNILTLIGNNQASQNQETTSTVSPPTSSDTTRQAPAPAAATPPAASAPQPAVPASSAAAPTDQTSTAPSNQQPAPSAETPLGSTEAQTTPPAPEDQTASSTPPAASAPEIKPKAPPAPAPAAGDYQEAEGEKYLYGNGVPQNCAKAQRSLSAAARKNNAKAQAVLGTMYSTGHCVSRDLPTAYGWFAKALHSEPDNKRYAGDLEVLWRQMTQAERQLALKAGQ